MAALVIYNNLLFQPCWRYTRSQMPPAFSFQTRRYEYAYIVHAPIVSLIFTNVGERDLG